MVKAGALGVLLGVIVSSAPEVAKIFRKMAWDGVRGELNALPMKKRLVVAYRVIWGKL